MSNKTQFAMYDEKDDQKIDPSRYWNKAECLPTGTVCPAMFSHECFEQVLSSHKHYSLMVPLISAAIKRNVDISDNELFKDLKIAFPYMFDSNFRDFIIPKQDFVELEFKLHPFDEIENGECALGEFSIDPENDYEVDAPGWRVDSGFMRPEKSDDLFFGLLEALRPFCALNSLQKTPASNVPMWVGVANHVYLPSLNIHVDQVHNGRKARSVMPVPTDAKVSPISFLYKSLEAMKPDERRYITTVITNGSYKPIMTKLEKTKCVVLRVCEGVVYSHLAVNPSQFSRPTIPQRIGVEELVWLVNWFGALKDPFGPMWYTGIAFGPDVKLVYENVCIIMRLIKYVGKDVEILHLKKKEPTALSLPPIGEGAMVKIISTVGAVQRFGREDVGLFPSVSSGSSKSVISFEVEPFPAVTPKMDSRIVQSMIGEEIGRIVSKYIKYEVCAVKVDYRYPLYIGKETANQECRFLPDADPLSRSVWLIIGNSSLKVDPSHFKAIYVRALQFRIDYMVFRMLNRKFIAKFYEHRKVHFLFKQRKVDLEFTMEKEDLDGILPDDGVETEHEEVDRQGRPIPTIKSAVLKKEVKYEPQVKTARPVSTPSKADAFPTEELEDPTSLFGDTVAKIEEEKK